MKVYLVRHGEVPHNVLKQFNSNNDDLTDLGIKQARELRDKIGDINFDVIISSPLVRALHTADIINKNNNKIIINDDLRERECGNLSGKSFDKNDRAEYWNYYAKTKYGTSEDIKMFFDRVYNFIDELKEKDYENVLVVTHSGVSKAFNGYFNGIGDGEFLHKGLSNCEIIEYEL